jgi:putative membrane protein
MYVSLPRTFTGTLRAVFRYQWQNLLITFFYASFVFILYELADEKLVSIGSAPISILGVALSIFLGFRNNWAYDRWWEARKIWGGIINYSRSFAMQILTLLDERHMKQEVRQDVHQLQRTFIYRHIAWINALRLQLRDQSAWDEVRAFLPEDEFGALPGQVNKATQINLQQAKQLNEVYETGLADDFRHIEIMQSLKEFYNLQGKCERIKKTPFIRYYDLLTRVFLWIFIVLLPFGLLVNVGIATIPLTMTIAFAFSIIEQTGRYTENPFDNSPNDIPLTSMCNTIERDLRQMLGETELPDATQAVNGVMW